MVTSATLIIYEFKVVNEFRRQTGLNQPGFVSPHQLFPVP